MLFMKKDRVIIVLFMIIICFLIFSKKSVCSKSSFKTGYTTYIIDKIDELSASEDRNDLIFDISYPSAGKCRLDSGGFLIGPFDSCVISNDIERTAVLWDKIKESGIFDISAQHLVQVAEMQFKSADSSVLALQGEVVFFLEIEGKPFFLLRLPIVLYENSELSDSPEIKRLQAVHNLLYDECRQHLSKITESMIK